MSIFAVAIGTSALGSIFGGVMSMVGASKASNAQQYAAQLALLDSREARAQQQQMFNMMQERLAPYMEAGGAALHELMGLIGMDVTKTEYGLGEMKKGADPFGTQTLAELFPDDAGRDSPLYPAMLEIWGDIPVSGKEPQKIYDAMVRRNPDLANDKAFNAVYQRAKDSELTIDEWHNFAGLYRDEVITRADALGIPHEEIRSRSAELGIDPVIAGQLFPRVVTSEKTIPGAESQQRQIQGIMDSPLYTTALKEGERAILRQLNAVGQLRGGTAQETVGRFAPTLLNELIRERMQALSGIAGMGQSTAVGAQSGMANFAGILNQNSAMAQQALQSQGNAAAQGALSMYGSAGQMVQNIGNIPMQFAAINRLNNMGNQGDPGNSRFGGPAYNNWAIGADAGGSGGFFGRATAGMR